MCDKKNIILFNDTECIVLSPNFKLIDESQVLLEVPRKNNMYSVDLRNIVPKGGLTCLFAKATSDESKLWHRRLGHLNFKTMNKLVKGNLVRATMDETSGILKNFITRIQNLLDYRVKVIIYDNGTEFKNSVMNQFCEMKGIKREFSVAKTPQQNGVAERKNRTLIEAARTLLVDSKLPLLFGTPALSFMRPFRCPVTILNTKDHLGKFNGKADEGFFVGYSLNSKAFRVFNSRTKIVEESLHIRFNENTPNVAGSGPDWLFDIDALTKTMNYKPLVAGTQTNGIDGTKSNDNAGQASKETKPDRKYILLPLWTLDPPFFENSKSFDDEGFKPSKDDEKKDDENSRKEVNADDKNISIELPYDPNMHALEEIDRFGDVEDDNSGDDMNNLDTYFQVCPVTTTRIHKHHPLNQVIGDL
ncbi:ribonuclease H-like domain-containing protein [Tanacetum coccineum]